MRVRVYQGAEACLYLNEVRVAGPVPPALLKPAYTWEIPLESARLALQYDIGHGLEEARAELREVRELLQAADACDPDCCSFEGETTLDAARRLLKKNEKLQVDLCHAQERLEDRGRRKRREERAWKCFMAFMRRGTMTVEKAIEASFRAADVFEEAGKT